MRTIKGRAGADHIKGGLLADQIYGNAGNDLIFAGSGDDTVYGGIGNDSLHGDAGNDNLNGDAGNDVLYGDTGNDKLAGGAGNDLMYGGIGDDVFTDTSGADLFNGGTGNDSVDYSGLTGGRGVDVHLNLGLGGRDAAHDRYVSIENVTGTSHNDFLWGNASNNVLNAGEGNDFVRGFDGDDTIIGGGGADELYGDAGNDTIRMGEGNDIVFGGAGFDWLDFTDTGPLDINVFTNVQTGPYTAFDPITNNGDQIFEIEGLRGSPGDDNLLFGSPVAGVTTFLALDGGAGDDYLSGAVDYYGGAGVDKIILSRPSFDALGNPLPDFSETVHLQLDKGIDGIANFVNGSDKLAVSRSEFGLALDSLGNTVHDFVSADSNASSTGLPSFIYEATTRILWFDADGTGGEAAPIAVARMYNSGVVLATDLYFIA